MSIDSEQASGEDLEWPLGALLHQRATTRWGNLSGTGDPECWRNDCLHPKTSKLILALQNGLFSFMSVRCF